MPKKGYKQTEKHKKNTLKSRRYTSWNRGKKEVRPEVIVKMSKVKIGKYVCENSPSYRGGVYQMSNKRHLLLMPEHPYSNCQGYILVSRYCAEAYLGRFLEKNEIVHHIDGDKTNDLPENLYIFSSQSEHTIYHHQIRKNKVEPITKSNLL